MGHARTNRGRRLLASALLAGLSGGGCAAEPLPADGAPPYTTQALGRPAWTEAGALSVARQWHSATALEDGRVLVVGGQKLGSVDTGDVCFETAEVYEANGGWSSVEAMLHKRSQHVAVRLDDGAVLVVGGYSCGGAPSEQTAEIFEPVTGVWLPAAPPAQGRVGAAAARLDDGRVLVTGGGGTGREAEVYDPTADAWTSVAPMAIGRAHHTATRMPGGRVLVAGGDPFDGSPGAVASAEIFDVAAGAWGAPIAMDVGRTAHTATALLDGRVLLAGGSSSPSIEDHGELSAAALYDPALPGWAAVAPMATARALHTATLLGGGAVLIAGGADTVASTLRSAELFDPDTAAWAPLAAMNHSRLGAAAAPLPGGGAIVAGGEDQSSTEIYRAGEKGQVCSFHRECSSGHCVDGVCCDTACTGMCLTCARAGAMGTCSPAAKDTDPRHECGQGGPCDDVCGPGVCVDRVGEACGAPSCDADGRRAIVAGTCAVSGGSCPMAQVDCGAYGCDAGACRSTCARVTDCAPGHACDAAGRCVQAPDVSDGGPGTCAAGAEVQGRGAVAWSWMGLAGLAALARRRRAGRRS